MWGHPGKKLLFMGGEFGQWREWNHEASLDWHLCAYPLHAGVRQWLRDFHRHYLRTAALHERDFRAEGFEWIDCADSANSVIAFLRRPREHGAWSLVACNFTPVPRVGYRLGVPVGGRWREALNSDAAEYGGSGMGNLGGVDAEPRPCHGRPHSLTLTLPPLGVAFFEAAT